MRSYLSKREQQITEVLYRHGPMTAAQITSELPGEPAKSTVRTLLKILEDRGHVFHEDVEGTFVYRPVEATPSAARRALAGVLGTFFAGSVREAVAALLDESEPLSDSDSAELRALIEGARQESAAPEEKP